jgi:hypothetical protein
MSRKDDMINLFYVLIYLATKNLPWFDYMTTIKFQQINAQIVHKIDTLKFACSAQDLCSGLPGIILTNINVIFI